MLQKVRSATRVVFINIIVLLVLLWLINQVSGLVLYMSRDPERWELPNYEADRDHGKEIFKDYQSLGYEYYPFVGWKAKPYKGKTTTISQDGIRIHEPVERTDTTGKVSMFFGGSTMWGEGSDDQHTIPALFNELNPGYKVTNYAQLAYNTRQEFDELITQYSKGKNPSLVVFYDGVNDASFLCPSEITELPGHRLVPMFRDRIYISNVRIAKKALYNIFLEKTVRAIQHFQKGNSGRYNCLSDPAKAEEIATLFVRHWEMAHEMVTARGGKFIAILQPASFYGKPNTSYLKFDDDLQQNARKVYELISGKLKEKNYDWVYDMSDAFDGEEKYYIDFCHVSANGNEVIAKKIAAIVKDSTAVAN